MQEKKGQNVKNFAVLVYVLQCFIFHVKKKFEIFQKTFFALLYI